MVMSSLSLSYCLSSFVGFDFSRFFPYLSRSRSVSVSVVIRSNHFVALEHVACVSGGAERCSYSILTMLPVLFISPDASLLLLSGYSTVMGPCLFCSPSSNDRNGRSLI